MADHFKLDDEGVSFHEKKHKTSFMRRLAPDGVATCLVWTANIRVLRHTIEMRTDPGAEEEIRLVFGKIGELARAEARPSSAITPSPTGPGCLKLAQGLAHLPGRSRNCQN